jgi:hypothetical protein
MRVGESRCVLLADRPDAAAPRVPWMHVEHDLV